ncbi:mitochondrial carrier domain-containing protein [Gilbertella persicaria]|uniref:mitochondrial carrier domain-containing protein n=1 Tax=Gilbertella persicaria TaxID=101096 RepID=UPI002220A8D9|nr:mitochondrial carrier domain-containing protein [Gilbertella persicaria]KAI8083351.1 mitochondrial carrier domain-containing protein [Gilbertella persicaria]
MKQNKLHRTSLLFGHFAETGRLLVRINQVEGFRGYFKGLGPNLVGVIPARSINFFTYGNGKKFYADLFGKEDARVHLISAATAGVITSTATNPIWVIKTRLQLQGANGVRKYRGSWDCLTSILKQEGLGGLYKGMSASYLGVAEGTIQWVIYENLKRKWKSSDTDSESKKIGGKTLQDWVGHLSAAATSKFVAACVAYPHEVIRTRLRQPADQHGVQKYTGLWQSLKLIVKEEGVVALYGGMTAHLMRVVPNAAIMFFCYEAIVQKYGNNLS